jgi:peroxiredoxin
MQYSSVESAGRKLITKTTYDVDSVARTLEEAHTENGVPFVELVEESPVLLVFLRHAGCTFCREALSDISVSRDRIEADGVRIVLVHLGDRAEMKKIVARYGLSDLERVCDPDHRLYEAFGLKRGSWDKVYGPKVWMRGIIAGLFRGHGFEWPVADYTQMPGVFYIEKGLVLKSYRHKSAADRPCYEDLCTGPLEHSRSSKGSS